MSLKNKLKIAFVVGHTSFSKGKYSEYFKRKEFTFWKGFECELKEIGDVFYHNSLNFSYTSRQKEMSKKTRNYDLVFELHFNSFNTTTSGCEAFYFLGNKQTRKIASNFCRHYSLLSKTRNRGEKSLWNKSQNGFGFVKEQKPNAILLEPFFGDNENDCKCFNINNFILSIKRSLIK